MKQDTAMMAALSRLAGMVDAVHSLPLMRPLERRVLMRALRWRAAAATDGLPVARNRAEGAAMRRAVAAGLAQSSGTTSGTRHKLTVAGVRATACPENWKNAGKMLARIATAQEASGVSLPGRPADRLCMPWHLLPEAGEWLAKAERTAAAWRAYGRALVALDDAVLPLLACAYVCRLQAADGHLWALRVTDAGREALAAPWPAGGDGVAVDAWAGGWDRGMKLAQTEPPHETAAVMPRLLPCTAWQ